MPSVQPEILALIVRRVRQLKLRRSPPIQDVIVKYVCGRKSVSEQAVLEQLKLAVENGILVARPPQPNKNYMSYTFAEGKKPTSPLSKSPSPVSTRSLKSSDTPLPSESERKREVSTCRRVFSPKTSPMKRTSFRGNVRPELVVDDEKDMTTHIKTALIRMERPYGSSIKVLTKYFDTKFKVDITVGKDESREKAIHKVLLKWATIGVRRGLLAKHERMFRVAPVHMYKSAPEGPITEKLQCAFVTLKKEKERARKSAQPHAICSFCLKPESENREGKTEEMVNCVTCGNAGHPSCLTWSEELTKKVRSLPSWECMECKWCSVCREAGNDSMLFCDTCDRGYHLECCEPVLSKPPKGDWACLLCLFERYDEGQMALYLETHKSPHRRLSASSPSRVRFLGKTPETSRKSVSTPKLSGRKKRKSEESSSSDSSEDDAPLRSCSTGFGKSQPISPAGSSRRRSDQLTDPLSKFFTPSNKRQSSVARKSFESLVAIARERKQLKNSRQAADKLVKRSRKELNRHTLHEKNKLTAKEKRKSAKSDVSLIEDSLPDHCTNTDLEWFNEFEEKAKDLIGPEEKIGDNGPCPPVVVIGRFKIHTWYSAPYPQEYAKLPKLWICEFCLQYNKSRSVLEHHMLKCDLKSPPGDEIYRNGNLSVFEVDGHVSKMYCQNLCLLAKLFIDHKTLYYDVEPFLFYVLTVNDQYGSHLAGYFSKEKHCAQKYNVSCIMILPTYQKSGYGRFLMSFSYLLSRQENQPGTPERPLSELGRLAYQAYWRDQVLDYLVRNPEAPAMVIHDISSRTGMSPHDIAATMQELDLVRMASDGSDRLVVVIDEKQLRDYKDKIARKPPIASIEPSALRWTPPPSIRDNLQQTVPPPVHNEYIEQLKTNPAPPPSTERKKRKRKRKMSPWRRQRQITKAARTKRLQQKSQNDEAEEGDEEGESDDQSGEEAKKSESESDSPAGKSTNKKTKRESRSRQRRVSGRKADSSSESDHNEIDEDDGEGDEESESKKNGNSESKKDDDDEGSTGGSGANAGPGSGSENNGNKEDSNSRSGSSNDNGNDASSPSTKSSYTTASDSHSATVPADESGRSRRTTTVLNTQASTQALRPIRPRPPARQKENIAVERPASAHSNSASTTVLRPLPSAKDTVRNRRMGLKSHKVLSVLNADDSETSFVRNTGPIVKPVVSQQLPQTDLSQTALMAEFAQSSSAQPGPSRQQQQQSSALPVAVQSKVEAALSNLRKEQKVLSELAPTSNASSTVDSMAMFTMPIMPLSYLSSGFGSVDEEMAMPAPPSATVATVPVASGGYGASSELTVLNGTPKLTALNPISPSKKSLSSMGSSGATVPVAPASSYTPRFVNQEGSSSVAANSRPPQLAFPTHFPQPPSQFDLAAAAASFMSAQQTNPLLKSNAVAPAMNNAQLFYNPGAQSTGMSPQPAAAAVYQAIGGIYASSPVAFTNNMPQRPYLPQQPPNQHRWY